MPLSPNTEKHALEALSKAIAPITGRLAEEVDDPDFVSTQSFHFGLFADQADNLCSAVQQVRRANPLSKLTPLLITSSEIADRLLSRLPAKAVRSTASPGDLLGIHLTRSEALTLISAQLRLHARLVSLATKAEPSHVQ